MKWKEEWKISNGIFDEATGKILYKLANDGYIQQLVGIVATGKEADVFLGVDIEGKEVAVKIYRYETSTFQSMEKYVMGDERFKDARMGKRNIVPIWTKKEFKNLELAYNAGVRVPKPITSRRNVLVMEFIGQNGKSAPTAKNCPPKNPKMWLKKVLNMIRTLFEKEGLVHGDLSEYNILNFDEEPVLIDMGQGLLKTHQYARELLMKDIVNVLKWFKKLNIDVPEAKSIYNEIVEKDK